LKLGVGILISPALTVTEGFSFFGFCRALTFMAKGMMMSINWVEAKSYDEMVCDCRCVYAVVARGSIVDVWLSARCGSEDEKLAQADETLAKAALLTGSKLFFTCLPLHHWEQFAEMKEELSRDLQRHVQSLPKA